MIHIDIEQGPDLAAVNGLRTVVKIETRRDFYRVKASKIGRPNSPYRVVDVPRDGGKKMYELLAAVFAELSS